MPHGDNQDIQTFSVSKYMHDINALYPACFLHTLDIKHLSTLSNRRSDVALAQCFITQFPETTFMLTGFAAGVFTPQSVKITFLKILFYFVI